MTDQWESEPFQVQDMGYQRTLFYLAKDGSGRMKTVLEAGGVSTVVYEDPDPAEQQRELEERKARQQRAEVESLKAQLAAAEAVFRQERETVETEPPREFWKWLKLRRR